VTKTCSECGKTYQPRQWNSAFCGTPCSKVFNNRRAMRGAIMYDLIVAQDAKPEAFASAGLEGRLDDLLAAWKEEDAAKGRKRSVKGLHDIAAETLAYATRRARPPA
jgi:hypothetical protein